MRATEFITEKWSEKYKRSINCNNPKGFSQKAHCAGRKKHTSEDVAEQNFHPDALTMPDNTVVVDTPGELDWYKIGQHYPVLNTLDPLEFGQGESDMVITFPNAEEKQKFVALVNKYGMKTKDIGLTPSHPEIHDTPTGAY